MTNMLAFDPDWLSPPGATILDLLDERKCSIREFASAIHRHTRDVSRLLSGIERLTPEWAHQLSRTLGASPDFWLRREEQYRKNFEQLFQFSNLQAATVWLDGMPVKDLVRLGWVDKGTSRIETLMNTLAFFGVSSVDAWRHRYKDALEAVAYRTSTAYEINPGAVAAWLRQGEIEANEVDCAPWRPDLLREMLPTIKVLSQEPDPAVFLPRLTECFAQCGVAVAIAPLPEGCRASGAVRFLTPRKALILLSFRYLSDDQFWFTVFHEAGHLLLHSDEELFLEGIEVKNTQAEIEADSFATTTLFGEKGIAEMRTLALNSFAIARFAKRAGVAPGIVVGQLQESGRVSYRHFNYLKARYEWAEQ